MTTAYRTESAAGADAGGSGRLRRALLFGVPILLLLLLALALSRQRSFQVDEVEHLHTTYNIAAGQRLYLDFWEGHNPLLYGLLRPLVDPADPVGSFRRARWVPFLVLLATAAATAWCARRLSGDLAAWLAAALLVSHSTMVERGIEVRPDGLLALATMLALAFEVGPWSERKRSAAAALVLGFGFLATQKAAIVCVAFAVLWGARAVRAQRAAPFFEPAAIGALPFALFVGWLAHAGTLSSYLESNFGILLRRVGRSVASGGEFSPALYLVKEGRFNLVFALLALATLFGLLAELARRGRAARHAGVALFAWVLFASLWINPFPFPYLHVTVIPGLALVVALRFVDQVEGWEWARAPRRRELVAALLVLACAATSVPRMASRFDDLQRRQLEILAEVQRVTAPGDTVFDLAGLYFRRDAYPVFVMTGAMLARYFAGGFPQMVPYFEERAPMAVMLNYRTRTLEGDERRFLLEHYVHQDGPLFVHGREIEQLAPGEERSFRALKTAAFRWEGPAGLLVDGRPFGDGVLERGEHRLGAARPLRRGRLVYALATREPSRVRPPFELYPTFD